MSVRKEFDQSDERVGCPDCGCTNPECKNGCKISKIDEIHAWLAEVMPAARLAIKMMNARSQLMARWRGNAK